MKTSTSEFILACAQVFLASIMAIGFLGALFVLIFYHGQLDSQTNALLTGLVGVLGTIVTQQNGYFFQRQRPPTLPEPLPLGGSSSTSTTVTSSSTPGAPPHAAPPNTAPPAVPPPIVAGPDAAPAPGNPPI